MQAGSLRRFRGNSLMIVAAASMVMLHLTNGLPLSHADLNLAFTALGMAGSVSLPPPPADQPGHGTMHGCM